MNATMSRLTRYVALPALALATAIAFATTPAHASPRHGCQFINGQVICPPAGQQQQQGKGGQQQQQGPGGQQQQQQGKGGQQQQQQQQQSQSVVVNSSSSASASTGPVNVTVQVPETTPTPAPVIVQTVNVPVEVGVSVDRGLAGQYAPGDLLGIGYVVSQPMEVEIAIVIPNDRIQLFAGHADGPGNLTTAVPNLPGILVLEINGRTADGAAAKDTTWIVVAK